MPESRSAGVAAALGAIAVLLSLAPSVRPRCAFAAWAAAFFAAATWSAARGDEAFARRIAWLLAEGRSTERLLHARVLRSAEREAEGQRRLRVAVRGPEPGWNGEPAVVQVSIPTDAESDGAAIDRWLRGDRIELWARVRALPGPRNPGEIDLASSFRARGIDALATVKSARLVRRLGAGEPSLSRSLDGVRAAARRRLHRVFAEDPATREVVGAMLLGDRALFDAGRWRALRDAGLLHLLSISGLHVGLIVAATLATFRRLRFGVVATAGFSIPWMAALAWTVGGEPPVVRAVMSASLALAGRALGREADPLNSLALGGAILVAARPATLVDAAFQLSFAGTAGILLWAGRMSRALPLPRQLAVPVSVSVSASLATTPVLALFFARTNPVAVLSNLLAAPLCGLTLLSASLAIVLADLTVVGPLAAKVAAESVAVLLRIAEHAAQLPAAALAVAPLPLPIALLYGLSLLCCSGSRRAARGAPLVARIAPLVVAILFAAWHLGPPPRRPPRLETTVLDVGQAQCVVVRRSPGSAIVIDAGDPRGKIPDAGERTILPYLARRRIRRIDALVVSHEHVDHAGSVGSVIGDMELGEIWLPTGFQHRPNLAWLADRAAEGGAAVILARRGATRDFSGVPLKVLDAPVATRGAPANERCLVVMCGKPPHRLLLPSDLTRREALRLVRDAAPLRSEAWLLPHHGAAEASPDGLLDAVRPDVSIVSVGERNRFGHPAASVIERLRARRSRVFRTDLDGGVVLTAEPSGWEASSFLRPAAAVTGKSRSERQRDRDEAGREEQ